MLNKKQLSRILSPVASRVKGMLVKGLLSAIDDSTEIQLIKVSTSENSVLEAVERLQDYGLSTVPPVNESEVLLGAIGSNRSHSVAFKVDASKYRPKGLKQKDVCLYDAHGNKILLTKDGIKLTTVTGGKISFGLDSINPLAGVLTGECLDPVTGVPFPDKSASVFASKV